MSGTSTLGIVAQVCETVTWSLRAGDTDHPYTLKKVTHAGGAEGFRFTTVILVDGQPVEVQVRSLAEPQKVA